MKRAYKQSRKADQIIILSVDFTNHKLNLKSQAKSFCQTSL